MQRFTFVIAPVLLLLLAVPTWAQDTPAEPPPGQEPPPTEQPAPEEPPGEQPTAPAEPAGDAAIVDQARSAQRQIRMIEIIQALQLNRGQVEALADLMAQIQADKAEIAKLEGAVRDRDLRKIESVITDWTELKQISPQDFAAAQQVGAKQRPDIARLRGHVAALVGQAIEQVLDAEQRSGIETPQERLTKLRRTERILQNRMVDVEGLMKSLEKAVQLDPEQFNQQSEALADRLAADVAGPDSPYLATVKQRMMRVLQDLKRIPQPEWQANRENIQSMICNQLGIEPPEAKAEPGRVKPDVVPQESFYVFMTDPEALPLLTKILERGQEAPPEGEGEGEGEGGLGLASMGGAAA